MSTARSSTTRRTVRALLPLLLLCLLPGRVRSQDLDQRVFIFMDASGSMSRDNTANENKYDVALRWIEEDLDVEVGAGLIYRVIPFDQIPLDQAGKPRSFSGPDAPKQVVGYLRPYKPRSIHRRTAIWDTILLYLDEMMTAGPDTSIRVYTDGEDTFSSAKKEDVIAALRKGWKLAADVRIGLEKYDITKPRASRASVTILKPDGFSERASDWSGMRTLEIPVRARFSRNVTSRCAIRSVDVRCEPLTPGATPVWMTARMQSPLSDSQRETKVILECKADFPRAAFEHRYLIRLDFEFRSAVEGLDPGERKTVVPGSPSVPLTVTMDPRPELSLDGPGSYDLYPKEVRRVGVRVKGNKSAGSLPCKIQVVTPAGVRAGLARREDEPGEADLGAGELSLELPERGREVRLLLTFTGDRPTDGRIYLNAVTAGGRDSEHVGLRVQAPTLHAQLTFGDKPTELVEKEGAEFQPLDCGPVQFRWEGRPPAKAVANLSIAGSTENVEFAFDPSGARRKSVEIGGSTPGTAEVFGRWKKLPGANGEFVLPRIAVAVACDFPVPVDPKDLHPRIVLSAPDFWVSAPGAASEGEAGIRFPEMKARAGDSVTRRVVVDWNAAATGGILRIGAMDPAGGRLLSIRPVSGLETTAEGRIRLGDEVHRSGTLQVDVEAAAATGKHDYSISLTLLADRTERGRRTIRFPVTVGPTILSANLDVDRSKVYSVYRGASLPIGTLTVGSDGVAGEMKVRAEFSPPLEGGALELSLGDTGGDTLAVPAGGRRSAEIRIRPMVDVSELANALGRELGASLVLEPGESVGEVLVSDVSPGGEGKPARRLEIPLTFLLKAWTLEAFYNERECSQLRPHDRFPIKERGQKLRTSALPRPFSLRVVGGVALPEDLLDQKLRIELVEPGSHLHAAAFELPDGTESAEVPLGQLDQAHIVLTAREAVGRAWFTDDRAEGEIVLRCESPPLLLTLPVKTSVVAKFPLFQLVLALIACGIVGLLVYRRVVKPRERPEAAPGEIETDEEVDLDDETRRARRQKAAPTPAPAPAPKKRKTGAPPPPPEGGSDDPESDDNIDIDD